MALTKRQKAAMAKHKVHHTAKQFKRAAKTAKKRK